MNEIWKPIAGYENYYDISNLGNVQSKGKKYTDSLGRNMNKAPKKISVRIGTIGYLCVDLNCNGISTQKHIHRLVAEAFIPNPENKPTVNHKDGNKLNNDISNLEWATYSENNKHAIDIGLRQSPWTGVFGADNPQSKPVVQLNKKGEIINTFVSAREAQEKTGISYKHISDCCLGKRHTTGGFRWEFLKDNLL